MVLAIRSKSIIGLVLAASAGYYSAPFLLRRIKIFSLYLSSQLVQHFARSFEFSMLVSLFSHSAKSVFRQQLLSKAIHNEQSQYQKIKSNRNGINP